MLLIIFDTSIYLYLSTLHEMIDNPIYSIFPVLFYTIPQPHSYSKLNTVLSFIRASVVFTIKCWLKQIKLQTFNLGLYLCFSVTVFSKE